MTLSTLIFSALLGATPATDLPADPFQCTADTSSRRRPLSRKQHTHLGRGPIIGLLHQTEKEGPE